MKTLEYYTKKINQAKLPQNKKITSGSKMARDIQTNSLQAVDILTKRFLRKISVPGSKVQIHDTKEFKDIITVFQQLKEINAGNHQETPQINTDAVNFISSNLKEPKTNKDATLGVNKKLKNLSSKQVQKLAHNQETELNKRNVKKM